MYINFIYEIKQKLKINNVLEHYLGQSKKNCGKSEWWCCPFHSDKNASLKIYKDRFKCFGCNEFGDIFDFVEKYFSIEKKIDIAIKLNNDFNLGLLFDHEETSEDKKKRLALQKKRETEKLKKKNLEKFTREVSDKIILRLRICEKFVLDYHNKPLEWLYEHDKTTNSIIYATNEIDRLDYLYVLINGLCVDYKSYWYEYYGENSLEILRNIYKGKIKIEQ